MDALMRATEDFPETPWRLLPDSDRWSPGWTIRQRRCEPDRMRRHSLARDTPASQAVADLSPNVTYESTAACERRNPHEQHQPFARVVPDGMGHAGRGPHRGTGPRRLHVVADREAAGAFDHEVELVLIGVHVRLGDPLARTKVSKRVGAPDQVGSLAVAIGLGIED